MFCFKSDTTSFKFINCTFDNLIIIKDYLLFSYRLYIINSTFKNIIHIDNSDNYNHFRFASLIRTIDELLIIQNCYFNNITTGGVLIVGEVDNMIVKNSVFKYKINQFYAKFLKLILLFFL